MSSSTERPIASLRRIAEHALGGDCSRPRCDSRVDDDDRVHRRVDDRREARFGLRAFGEPAEVDRAVVRVDRECGDEQNAEQQQRFEAQRGRASARTSPSSGSRSRSPTAARRMRCDANSIGAPSRAAMLRNDESRAVASARQADRSADARAPTSRARRTRCAPTERIAHAAPRAPPTPSLPTRGVPVDGQHAIQIRAQDHGGAGDVARRCRSTMIGVAMPIVTIAVVLLGRADTRRAGVESPAWPPLSSAAVMRLPPTEPWRRAARADHPDRRRSRDAGAVSIWKCRIRPAIPGLSVVESVPWMPAMSASVRAVGFAIERSRRRSCAPRATTLALSMRSLPARVAGCEVADVPPDEHGQRQRAERCRGLPRRCGARGFFPRGHGYWTIRAASSVIAETKRRSPGRTTSGRRLIEPGQGPRSLDAPQDDALS